MNIESKLSGHWTDDDLIAYLYGVGPENDHLSTCAQCEQRLAAIQAERRLVETEYPSGEEVSFDFLAGQRRKIYARIEQPAHWWSGIAVRRWAPTAAAFVVLAGGLAVVDQTHRAAIAQRQAEMARVSDAELAAEVSQIADSSEPPATAPLQALFED
ncbi:MAG: hypothetical protein JO061_21075 [Acidobacteriaceae bacterium]|nr:hypothetical protein [Acidobacteriaceae bacterium]